MSYTFTKSIYFDAYRERNQNPVEIDRVHLCWEEK